MKTARQLRFLLEEVPLGPKVSASPGPLQAHVLPRLVCNGVLELHISGTQFHCMHVVQRLA